MPKKFEVKNLAIFGSAPLFNHTRSTSNLVRPDFSQFTHYSKMFFNKHQYTNNGPVVRLLEERLSEFHQAKYCVAFCNGFWALVLAMRSLAIEGKREVLMPSFTYRRMADIVAWVRLVPRFYDVNPEHLTADADCVEKYVNDDTALILGVHPIVNCCDVKGLTLLSQNRSIPLLFDSVESGYESIDEGKIGSFGDAEVFSLHASKLLNGFEGGYLTTNNQDLAEELSYARGFGFNASDEIVVGDSINAKLNEIHAAMALAALDDLEDQVRRNRERYYSYRDKLRTIPCIRLVEFDESHKTSYKNIVIELLADWPLGRKDTLEILNAENILARAYYSPALHQRKFKYESIAANLKVTDSLAERFVLLPCGHFVDDSDIEKIVDLMGHLYRNCGAITAELDDQRMANNDE